MRTRYLLLTAALLASGVGAAGAQNAATYDPNQVPATRGRVAQYSLTPRGDVDGLILTDGTQVHLPPHLGAQLVQIIKPGEAVTIHGLRAQAIPVIQALSVTSDGSGRSVVDTGPPATPPTPLATDRQWMQVQGRVREPLYGPRGDLNGALLEDGTQVHLPPDQAMTMSALLASGVTLVAQGYAATGPYGKSIDAQKIGQSPTQMVQVGPPARRGGPGRPPPPPPPGRLGFAAPPPGGPGSAPPPAAGGPDAPPPR